MTLEQLKTAVGQHSELLSARERLVMRMRLEDGLTLLKIAQMFGLSSERIRQIQEEAIDKLRKADGIHAGLCGPSTSEELPHGT